jgi:hypothetical protein
MLLRKYDAAQGARGRIALKGLQEKYCLRAVLSYPKRSYSGGCPIFGLSCSHPSRDAPTPAFLSNRVLSLDLSEVPNYLPER